MTRCCFNARVTGVSPGIRQSMGAIGTSADNALAESFNTALKREVLQDLKTFANQLLCRRDVFGTACARMVI